MKAKKISTQRMYPLNLYITSEKKIAKEIIQRSYKNVYEFPIPIWIFL